jgi:DNA-binding NarL/FixJ family response regulator
MRCVRENDLVNGTFPGFEMQFMSSSKDAQIPIRVFLVDDQAMLRAGFKSLLARDARLEVVGDTGDSRLAAERVAHALPDVVLLDISMPGLSAIEAIPLIKQAYPRVKVVMLTHHEGEDFVQQALRAGANGCLSKDSDPNEMTLAIEAVARGDLYLSPRVVGGVLNPACRSAHAGVGASRISSLTPREREILQMLALGHTNKEIAGSLEISVGTTKKHRENLRRKLGCHSTAEIALLAVKEGLIEA